MSSVLKRIKSVSQWEKDLVIGYHKEAQKLLNSLQIPTAVSHLSLVYYHENEYFKNCPNSMELNQTRDQVTVKANDPCLVHGIY